MDFYENYQVSEAEKRSLQHELASKETELSKLTKKKGESMFKSYFQKHEETLMTIVLVMVIDHFFLNGALKDKIQGLLTGILDSTEKKLANEK